MQYVIRSIYTCIYECNFMQAFMKHLKRQIAYKHKIGGHCHFLENIHCTHEH